MEKGAQMPLLCQAAAPLFAVCVLLLSALLGLPLPAPREVQNPQVCSKLQVKQAETPQHCQRWALPSPDSVHKWTLKHWQATKTKTPNVFSNWNCFCIRTTLPKTPNLSAAHCKQPLVLSTVHLRWLWLLLITGSSKRSLLQKSWGSKILSSQGSKESGDEANLLFQVLKFGSIWNQDPHTWWKPSEYEWTNPDTLK